MLTDLRFDADLSLAVWLLLGVVLLTALFMLTVYYCKLKKIITVASAEPADRQEAPAVSVIVYSSGNAERLEALVPEIYAQEYPGEMEVIVVNAGRNENVKDAVTRLQHTYRKLYATFTTDQSRNLSHKKLAVTLGIKAAKNDVVVLTNDMVSIPSTQWLRLMTAPMNNPHTEVVIGHAYIVPECDTVHGHGMRLFNMAADAVSYITGVLDRGTYRGNRNNLAYRRELFFRHKGFHKSLNLHDGDDDIFINEVSTPHNTAVVVNKDAILGVTVPNARHAYRQEREARVFTGRQLRKRTRHFMSLCTAMMWIWLACSVTSVTLAWPNLLPVAVVAASVIALWIPLTMMWNKVLVLLAGHSQGVMPLPRMMWRPIHNLKYRISSRLHRDDHYTWLS